MNELSVSVVVPAYNSERTIEACLKCILSQTVSVQQVIVVDDGSIDRTAEIIQSFSGVSYVHQPNAGPAVARNRGAREAVTDVIFFTDADCEPAKNWIEQSIQHFAQPEVAVVSGSYGIANSDSVLARCVHNEIRFRHLKLMPRFPKAFGSFNFAVRRSVFEQVGGFNSLYRNASGEDNDLSYKICKAGHKICFEPDSLVAHHHPISVKKYLGEQYRHGFWRVMVYQSHPDMMKGDDYTFWKDIVEIPLAMLIFGVGILAVSGLLPINFLLLALVIGMVALQLFFSIYINKSIYDFIYGFVVFFLRSFSRMLGFSSGIVFFCVKKIIKKS